MQPWPASIMKLRFFALAFALVATGCAGRASSPIAMVQTGDQELSCSQLRAEVLRNEQQAQTLYDQHKKASDSNIAIGVVGAVLFWPALFALDTGTAEKDEARALEGRNSHLSFVSAQKKCSDTASNSSSAASTPDSTPVVPRGAPRTAAPAPTPAPAVAPTPASPSAIASAPPQTAANAGLASAPDLAARRLKSLDDMLVRKALTREEYDKKRLAILSGQ
jgi:hypothetical protein